MTEAEWLAATDPIPLLESQQRLATDRKFRLFAVAAVWPHVVALGDERVNAALDVAEADAVSRLDYSGEIDATGVWDIHKTLGGSVSGGLLIRIISLALGRRPFDSAVALVPLVPHLERIRGNRASADENRCECQRRLTAHVHDVFGNPFRSVGLRRQWRSDTAVPIARGMYESRDFSAMPILADALQDAGCDDEAILAHCRDETATHVRGCWVVDLVLGKE